MERLLVELFGDANLRKVENDELGSPWRRSWGNRPVLFIAQAVHKGRSGIANSLKEWITGADVTVNEKHVAGTSGGAASRGRVAPG